MKRSYFIPDTWSPDDNLIEWAMTKFGVTKAEVMRQVELVKDHEFRRPYSCWTRVFRNWMRKADEIQQLRRPRKLRSVEDETPEDRAQAQRDFENDPMIQKALGRIK